MVYSMTAFARREIKEDLGHAVWEIRSVNHRFLEISMRLPEQLRGLEIELRNITRRYLHRGKIECVLRYEVGNVINEEIIVREPLVKQLMEAAKKITSISAHPCHIDVLEIMQWPGVIQTNELDFTLINKMVIGLFEHTLDDLVKVRAREGTHLREAIIQKVQVMKEKVYFCEKWIPSVIRQQSDKLRARLEELQVELDKNRLEQEFVLLAQKIDISEELDRLKIHLSEIERVLTDDQQVGRRLDFLLQEMNREANTLGSKSVVKEISHTSVDLKVLIEQIREQVQNLE